MKKHLVLVLSALMIISLLAACAPSSEEASPSAPENSSASAASPSPSEEVSPSTAETSEEALPSGKLAVVGSTSVGPLMEKIKDKYNETNPNLSIEIQQVGSTAGIQAAIEGSADIGMASRDLTEDELAQGLVPVEMALDGIAVIVNNENSIEGLTTEQIQKIFKGEITNWKEVGGSDADITVISREEGSGTRGAFEELLELQQEIEKDGKKLKESIVTEKALIQEGTGGVKAGVAGNPNAIGYISLGVADDTIKALKVDGVEASVATVLDKTYKIMRPFLIMTKGDAAGNAKIFMDYILSDEAQTLVEEEHYIKVP